MKEKIVEDIDVCIPTWNSGKTLDRCLKSITKEISVNHIIIVDNFSTDDTINIARKYGAKIIQKKSGIGKAREYLINNVTTEYFAFIDSDVILRKGWFMPIFNKITSNPKIGAVSGLWFSDNPQERHYGEFFWKNIEPNDPMWERGFCINILIRTKSVKGIIIPEWMNNYEDKFIRNYIISKGFYWEITKKSLCDHMVGEISFWKTCIGRIYYGAGLRLWQNMDSNVSVKNFIYEFIFGPIYWFYVAFKVNDPLIIPFKFLCLFFTFLGYISSSNELLDKIEEDPDYKRQYNKFRKNKMI